MVFCSSLFSKDSDEKFIPFLVEKPLIEYKKEKKHNTNRPAAKVKSGPLGAPEMLVVEEGGNNLSSRSNDIFQKEFVPNNTDSEEDVPSSSHTTIREIKKISTSSIKEILEIYKKDLCPVNLGGQFEINLNVDISGKFLGVGASGGGSMKAVIDCRKCK